MTESYTCTFRSTNYSVNRVQSLYRILKSENLLVSPENYIVHVHTKTGDKFYLLDHDDFDGYFTLNFQGNNFDVIPVKSVENLYKEIVQTTDPIKNSDPTKTNVKVEKLKEFSNCTVFLEEFGERNNGVPIFSNWILSQHKQILKQHSKTKKSSISNTENKLSVCSEHLQLLNKLCKSGGFFQFTKIPENFIRYLVKSVLFNPCQDLASEELIHSSLSFLCNCVEKSNTLLHIVGDLIDPKMLTGDSFIKKYGVGILKLSLTLMNNLLELEKFDVEKIKPEIAKHMYILCNSSLKNPEISQQMVLLQNNCLKNVVDEFNSENGVRRVCDRADGLVENHENGWNSNMFVLPESLKIMVLETVFKVLNTCYDIKNPPPVNKFENLIFAPVIIQQTEHPVEFIYLICLDSLSRLILDMEVDLETPSDLKNLREMFHHQIKSVFQNSIKDFNTFNDIKTAFSKNNFFKMKALIEKKYSEDLKTVHGYSGMAMVKQTIETKVREIINENNLKILKCGLDVKIQVNNQMNYMTSSPVNYRPSVMSISPNCEVLYSRDSEDVVVKEITVLDKFKMNSGKINSGKMQEFSKTSGNCVFGLTITKEASILKIIFSSEKERDIAADVLSHVFPKIKLKSSSFQEAQISQMIKLFLGVHLLEIDDPSKIFEKNLGVKEIPAPPADYNFVDP